MRVVIDIPDPVWFQIASEAEKRDVKTGQVIVNAIRWALRERRRFDPPAEALYAPSENRALLERELREARRSGWRAPVRRKETA